MTTTAAQNDVVELETHADWRASDIGNTDDWTLRLTGTHHAELVGLLCIDSGVSGGESLVANAVGTYNALVRTRPDLTDVQIEAMDAYDALINDPDNQVEMALRPGDIQFVNNYHVLHGRRRYVDDADSGRVRWLKRLWLATDILGPDDRPDRFQRVGTMGHWGTLRTRA